MPLTEPDVGGRVDIADRDHFGLGRPEPLPDMGGSLAIHADHGDANFIIRPDRLGGARVGRMGHRRLDIRERRRGEAEGCFHERTSRDRHGGGSGHQGAEMPSKCTVPLA